MTRSCREVYRECIIIDFRLFVYFVFNFHSKLSCCDISVFSTKHPLVCRQVHQLRDTINRASLKQGAQSNIIANTMGFDDYYENWKGSTRYWYYVPNKAILILNVWDTYCYIVWVAKSPGGSITPLFERVFSNFPGRSFYLHVKKSTLKCTKDSDS